MENIVYIYTGLEYEKQQLIRCIKESSVLSCIKPTDTVVLKPNFVQERRDRDQDWDYVITHPCVISAVIESVAPLLAGYGSIVIADAPMTQSSFQKICEHLPVPEWKACCAEYQVKFSILDLRDEEWKQSDNHVTLERIKKEGDPQGKILVNLKKENSEFWNKKDTGQKLYGADYNIEETNQAHDGRNNLYSVSGTVINADVIINLPKLKSHKKAGITCCLKNLVGINTNKNYLPHHTLGTPEDGGDEFAGNSRKNSMESVLSTRAKRIAYRSRLASRLLVPMKKFAVRIFGDNRKTIRNGSWYGNDTLWRTILDLNKVMFYGNADGSLREDYLKNRKRYIAIVDAIYGGEGNGPGDPDKKDCGCLICGCNPVAVDAAAAKIMRFDYRKIPHIAHAFEVNRYKLFFGSYEDIRVVTDGVEELALNKMDNHQFELWKAADGWKGYIEES